jgi:hypothetical protein
MKEVITKILKKAGLFDAVAPLYRRVKRFPERTSGSPSISGGMQSSDQIEHNMAVFIARALERIRTTPVYSATPDSSYALADQCRGDNLVVIAIKR